MKEIIASIRHFLRDRFNLDDDKADEAEIVENIKRDVNFKGPNLWTLIFAIMIASIGLNINSTAVIIGAMLISPLMGPIMGVGLAVGTSDIDLLKLGIKNLTIAAVISIATSAIYFYITPLHQANSELLARTNPSLWDVFIAFFGGLAGIVAGTRNKKSNVIPGVSIATALMPPLCTAGFGLATGKWFYFAEALYLFFINSMFICLATVLIVRRLKFQKAHFRTELIERRVTRYISLIVIVTIIPSIFLASKIVHQSIFESDAKDFVQQEFNLPKTQVINKTFHVDGNQKTIELLLLGHELSDQALDSIRQRMPAYGLTKTKLIIRQGLNAKQQVDMAAIKASILEDVFREEKQLDTLVVTPEKNDPVIPDLRSELKSLYPEMQYYSLSRSILYNLQNSSQDTLTLITARFRKTPKRSERVKLKNWLTVRLKSDSVRLLIE